MVLTFNKKMMEQDGTETPGAGTETEQIYENAGIEQALIGEYADNIYTTVDSMTSNLTNFLSDYDVVTLAPRYRVSEKESKGAENLASGKPRYYPADYVEAAKEQIVQPEPDEPQVTES